MRKPKNCRICGETVPVGSRGPISDIHPACAGRPYDGKRKAVQAEMFPDEVQTPGRSKSDRIELSLKASAVELMAVGLSINSDPIQAALVAGLDVDDEEAARLAELARTNCADLIEGKSTAISKITRQAALFLILNLRASGHSLPPSQVAPSIKGLIQALELIDGGMTPGYGIVNLIFDLGGGEQISLSELGNALPSTKSIN